MKLRKILLAGVAAGAVAFTLASCNGLPKAYEKFQSDNKNFLEDETIYDNNLGSFYNVYKEARKENDDLNKRYAQMAIAEAKLLESGVMLPTSTQGGTYGVTKVAPHTVPFALWGNDEYRLYQMVVADKPLTKTVREALRTEWRAANIAGVAGAYVPAAKASLALAGYNTKDTYNAFYTTDPKTWDILATSRAADSEAIVNTVDGLLEYSPEGVQVNKLAENVTVSSDKKTYTFKIKEGVKWVKNDGSEYKELTAADFVAGFQHMLDSNKGLNYLVDGVIENVHEYLDGSADMDKVGVKAKDTYTVEYKLVDKTPYFLSMFGYGLFAPMNKDFYEEKGGKFGGDYDSSVETYKYGKDTTNILYCGPYRVTNATAKNKIVFSYNEKYHDAAKVNIKTINWTYNDGQDPTKPYTEFKAGTVDGATLNTSVLATSKTEKLAGDSETIFDKYALVSDTNATTFSNFMNIKRQTFINTDENARTAKTQKQVNATAEAMLNQNFRLAIDFAIDRKTYNAQSTGADVAEFSLRNTYTPYNFVTLTADTTVKINGTDKKFNAGTYYGEIIQAQLDADKCPIKAYDSTKGSGDGYDGWYNTTNAKAYLDKAIEDLKKLDIEVTKDKPIVLDFPTFTGSAIYANRGNAVKKSIEDTFGGLVMVNIVDCPTADDWYNVGYYTETGKEANYDMYDCSGWGPDYGDPSTYLDTFLPDGAGYMAKCIGLF